MNIIWDKDKEAKLLRERGISISEFARLIDAERYVATLKNPAREGQRIFIVPYNDYTYAVPYILDTDGNVVIKTIYPSRKYHKLYGGEND
jgi:uncharacterized DUF497 family protein